jgi:hypothetical protein
VRDVEYSRAIFRVCAPDGMGKSVHGKLRLYARGNDQALERTLPRGWPPRKAKRENIRQTDMQAQPGQQSNHIASSGQGWNLFNCPIFHTDYASDAGIKDEGN